MNEDNDNDNENDSDIDSHDNRREHAWLTSIEDEIVETVVSNAFAHRCDGDGDGEESSRQSQERTLTQQTRLPTRTDTRRMEQDPEIEIVGISSLPKDEIMSRDAPCRSTRSSASMSMSVNSTMTDCRQVLVEGRMILYTSSSSRPRSIPEGDVGVDGIRQAVSRVMDVIRIAMNDGLMNDAHTDIVQVSFVSKDYHQEGMEERKPTTASPTEGNEDESESSSTKEDDNDDDNLPTLAIYIMGAAGGGILIAACLGWMCNRHHHHNHHMNLGSIRRSNFHDDNKSVDVLGSLRQSEEEDDEEEDAPFESSQRFDFGLIRAETFKTRNPWEGPSSTTMTMDEITLSDDSNSNKDYNSSSSSPVICSHDQDHDHVNDNDNDNHHADMGSVGDNNSVVHDDDHSSMEECKTVEYE